MLLMREIGRGYSTLEKLCGYLNLSPRCKWIDLMKQKPVLEVYNTVALQSMTDLADECGWVARK